MERREEVRERWNWSLSLDFLDLVRPIFGIVSAHDSFLLFLIVMACLLLLWKESVVVCGGSLFACLKNLLTVAR